MEIEKQAKSWTENKNIIEWKGKDDPQIRGLYFSPLGRTVQHGTNEPWEQTTILVKYDMEKNTRHLLKPQLEP